MQKIAHAFISFFVISSLLLVGTLNAVLAQTTNASLSDDTSDAVELVLDTDESSDEDVDVDDFSDDELLEAEPDELPEAEVDDTLTDRLAGEMLLDVEGNGEVYYNDPVTGGKEYLADGRAAHRLLEFRGLGITNADLERIPVGENPDDPKACKESRLGKRLRGRILLAVEANGEAWYIRPKNCRRYYVGTFEGALKIMKFLSLGITKKDLSKVRDNKRHKAKQAFRHLVYARAEELGITLEEARQQIKGEVKDLHLCLRDARVQRDDDENTRREKAHDCVEDSSLPHLSKDRREEIKETIRETRREKIEHEEDGRGEKHLREFDVRKLHKHAKEIVEIRIKERIKKNGTEDRLEIKVKTKVKDGVLEHREERKEEHRDDAKENDDQSSLAPTDDTPSDSSGSGNSTSTSVTQ